MNSFCTCIPASAEYEPPEVEQGYVRISSSRWQYDGINAKLNLTDAPSDARVRVHHQHYRQDL